jgi:hypothetical protein
MSVRVCVSSEGGGELGCAIDTPHIAQYTHSICAALTPDGFPGPVLGPIPVPALGVWIQEHRTR